MKAMASHISDRSRKQRVTLAGSLAHALLAAALSDHDIVWPTIQYQANPVGFLEHVLGVNPWDKQAEVLMALAAPRARVSCKSGHKVGKSHLAAGAALWFYGSFEDARVVMSSVTDRQVNAILWREVKKMIANAGRCAECRANDPLGQSRCIECEFVHPIKEEPAELARTGLRAPDFREITGFTAKEAEAVAGISGRNLLYILDEASGIDDAIYEAIEGNRAGGARALYLGNPTKTEGEFFRSHTPEKRAFYITFTISSEDTPNVKAGKEIIPGLALREWVEEKRAEWGEDSALYQVRVKGNFAKQDATTVIPIWLLEEAEERWAGFEDEKGMGVTPPEAQGRLNIGLDVARFGDDDSVAAPRRNMQVLEVIAWHGIDELHVAINTMQVVRRYRHPREAKALVKVDTCGGIGIKVMAHLLNGRDEHGIWSDEIECVAVDVSRKSNIPNEFPLLRDQLWFGCRKWLKDGGALPADKKLAQELTVPTFAFTDRQQRKVESKDLMRKKLKRSPDRADAVCLSVYEPAEFRPVGEIEEQHEHIQGLEATIYHQRMPDPYEGVI